MRDYIPMMKIMLDDGAYAPVRAHEADAGLDLRSPIDFVIPKGGSYAVDTGFHISIPKGFYGKLESKSGLNCKHGVVSLGGTIDSGYTGSIVAKLYNFGDEEYYHVKAGDKIIQLIIMPCEYPILTLVTELEETDRGENGFGSSGK